MALMERATVILRGEKLLAELEAFRTEAQSLIPIERAIWADNGCARLHSEPPRDCRRPFGLSYAAMGVSSSMA